MACPICNMTMKNLGLAKDGKNLFHCVTCGTLKTETKMRCHPLVDGSVAEEFRDYTHEEFESPKLVPLACQLIRAVAACDHARLGNIMEVAVDIATKIEHCKEALGGAP